MTSVPSGNLAPLPGEIPNEIAGGLPVAYLSAFLALRQAGFHEGQSVLAPGAGGSVGNATLKVARALGASQLVSTAGNAAKEAVVAAAAAYARSASSTSSARAWPTGLPGSLLAVSTSSLMRSGGP
jgi:NADPH:quinone reductase-like Zn-dependent oxidoreductase